MTVAPRDIENSRISGSRHHTRDDRQQMTITINGESYDIDRDDLELLVDRDNPTGWIAEKLLNADREKRSPPTTKTEEASA